MSLVLATYTILESLAQLCRYVRGLGYAPARPVRRNAGEDL